jgi:hypothetical protein
MAADGVDRDEPMALSVGTRIGSYEILRAIGSGGAPAAARSEQSESSRRGRGWGPARLIEVAIGAQPGADEWR